MKGIQTFVIALTITVLLIGGTCATARDAESRKGSEVSSSNPVYYVIFHSPGPQWKDGISFRQQPGIEEHVQYMGGLFQRGLILMGGPFLDDSGGMMVSRISTLEETQRVANDDPAVKAGVLSVTVRSWMVPMATVELPAVQKAHEN